MRTQEEILRSIRDFRPQGGNWRRLELLLGELWDYEPSIDWVDPLLLVFERFPDDDGAGVFWSIVHGLESIEGYERILIDSNSARPSMMKRIMVQRLEG